MKINLNDPNRKIKVFLEDKEQEMLVLYEYSENGDDYLVALDLSNDECIAFKKDRETLSPLEEDELKIIQQIHEEFMEEVEFEE
ncbi:hypothetical protein [[Mycoplasma] gypis]|uniref:DUF1292 domain-containing protein n=1 Tax=[Mycoplasma] gypis TaxID=92404 RepID=A0ABZ2RNM3_9BACT|nr:hypothetical protein [[Mycoplasma] gypis]MBN0919465.1 hypothetical protein [[Mycoplasma] gypis]